MEQSSGELRRENANAYPRFEMHMERGNAAPSSVIASASEAIQNPSAERLWIASSQGLLAMTGVAPARPVRQFNTRLLSGLSSENVGTSISKRSPLSLTIW